MEDDGFGFGSLFESCLPLAPAGVKTNGGDLKIGRMEDERSTAFVEVQGIACMTAEASSVRVEFEFEIDRQRPNVRRESQRPSRPIGRLRRRRWI